MADQHEKWPQRSWAGILLIIIGFLFLMDTLDILNFGHVVGHWWPIILIIIGFMKLKGSDKGKGAILFVLGIVFLSATLDIINWGSIFRFWPLILIVVGASMILRARGGSLWSIGRTDETSGDFIRTNAIFGGTDRTVISDNFKGGDVMALFGGIDVDLRQSKISEDECNLSLTALFGGIEVRVPPDWEVSVSGTPIFGGIENKTSRTGSEKSEKRIHCSCVVAFGGIEIRN